MQNSIFFRSLVLLMVWLSLAACTTVPVKKAPDPERVATAKRFLQNVGAGDLAMRGFEKEMAVQTEGKPGMAEFMNRAFADIDGSFFLDLAAKVYARHLDQSDLTEVANHSENPAIQRFFKIVFDGIAEGKQLNEEEVMGQFNADEIMHIMKFSVSDGFANVQKALPRINKEMAEESRKLGEKVVRDYIQSQ